MIPDLIPISVPLRRMTQLGIKLHCNTSSSEPEVRSSNHISETAIGFVNPFTMTPYIMLQPLPFKSLPTDYSLIQHIVRVIINGLHYGLFVLSYNWPFFIKIRIISFHKANLEFTIFNSVLLKIPMWLSCKILKFQCH